MRVITQGLVKLGLLKGSRAGTDQDPAPTGAFFMHRTGHWLGMDVHDVGDYKVGDEWRVFEPGMALTVEPGIYIPAGTRGVSRRFWNIGVRIEDDVVVTRSGCEVLTDDAPKEPDAIEALMARGVSCRPGRTRSVDVAIVGGRHGGCESGPGARRHAR